MDRKAIIALVVAGVLLAQCCCCATSWVVFSGDSDVVKVDATVGSDDPVKLTSLQLALEEAVWSYQYAKSLTAIVLSTHSSDMTAEEWEGLYQESVGAWVYTAECADRLAALAERVPDREPPAPRPAESSLPAPLVELASDIGSAIVPEAAYAAEVPAEIGALDMEQWRTDDSVKLQDTQTKEALAVLAERAPVVLAFESAPSGSKLAEAAKFMKGDAERARDVLSENYQDMRASYNKDEKRAEIAWRVATTIETGSDVALFVGDLATGGGKVALTKSLSKNLLKRLANPKLLARAAREQLREKTFTTIIGGVDLVVGVYNRGLVIATGDDSAAFTLTSDVTAGLSTLIGLKSLKDHKGLVDNLAQMATSPGGWKTAFGWGATSASLTQKGVNALEASMNDDGAELRPHSVTFVESPEDADVAAIALQSAQPALESLMSTRGQFDERYAEVLADWDSAQRYDTEVAAPEPAEKPEPGDEPDAAGPLTEAEMRQGYADWVEVKITAIYRAMATPGSELNQQRPDAAERWVRITPQSDGSFRNEQGNSSGQDMDKPLDPLPWAPTYATWEAWAKRQDPERFRAWAASGFKPDVWQGITSGARDL